MSTAKPQTFHHEILDLKSIDKLPDTHIWMPWQLNNINNGKNSKAIPIVDLNAENAGELIGQACKTWGIFQVINHNISKNLIDEVERIVNALFALPFDQKIKALRVPGSPEGYGCPSFNAFFAKTMWTEGFTINGSPLEHARQLWPNDYQKFCDTMEDYQQAMKKLAARLMWLMLGALGVAKEDVPWATEEGGAAILQMNHYPACPDPDHAMGLAEHTDSTILSILHQASDICSLQAYLEDSNSWVSVPPHPDALVINVGDLMHLMTNGAYPSVLHRAVPNQTKSRLSISYFLGPPAGAEIGPLAKLVDESHPALYKPVSWGEFLRVKSETMSTSNLDHYDFRQLLKIKANASHESLEKSE